jgi:hypothetical protein
MGNSDLRVAFNTDRSHDAALVAEVRVTWPVFFYLLPTAVLGMIYGVSEAHYSRSPHLPVRLFCSTTRSIAFKSRTVRSANSV